MGPDPKDVCLALGVYVYYGKVNTADALKKLPHTDKGSVGVDRIQPWPFDARAKAVSVVSEAGLYKLVMRSDSTEARKFQDWVTRDVLPAIRKDGGYIMGEEKVVTGALRDSLHRPHHCPLPM